MNQLILMEPNIELKEKAMEYREEYIIYGEEVINGSASLYDFDNYEKWLIKVSELKEKNNSHFGVPTTTYFSIRKSDNKIIGTIQLRHELNEKFKNNGGHIGYGIRPSERKKGYATEQLKLAIEKAKELSIKKLMISCAKDNIGSAKAAINNGGVLTWEGYNKDFDEEVQIYWIDVE